MPWNDLSYQRFGLLTALQPTQKREGSHIVWICKCDCGTICEVNSNSLKTGNTSSCGCLNNKSLGEEKIVHYLNNKEILFKRQYSFENCISLQQYPLRFDFAIFNNDNELKCLIEYDGIQHYKPIDYFGGKDYFIYLKDCDSRKDFYCKEHKIPLLRINYKEINNIEK